ncbi:MAG: deoxyribodipyrimidine photo-lyase [Bacteroidales bacterium]|nr:deoxyribodipyrimidine photo-lyase [Bacteroidales bacterium]
MSTHKLSLHIFRRDLRLEDNTALINALKSSEKVIPCFIFDDRQVNDNPYFSENAFRFMTESLADLSQQLQKAGGRLYFFRGITHDIVEQLIIQMGIDAVFINRDYTPFSIKRDDAIMQACLKHGVQLKKYADALLNEPEQVLKDDGSPYVVFTPFFKKSGQLEVCLPQKITRKNFFTEEITFELPAFGLKEITPPSDKNIFLKGGRAEALKLLERLPELNDYHAERDIPSLPGTSFLSPHNKFGTVSIREVYHSIIRYHGFNHTLINELYWRDFFTHIAYHFPRIFGHAFHKKYDKLEWDDNQDKFMAWCEGRTGFPIVDAGMRQLNTTGWMHNRIRMITSGFLIKDLHIDWRKGEKYFAQKLIDYDPSVNNGNWQWAASTGCDAQPYFRIFNPWVQQKRYDPECKYIRQWVPELSSLSNKTIHNWDVLATKDIGYPAPAVDHKTASAFAKASYRMMSET